jgi:hypothetical protein
VVTSWRIALCLSTFIIRPQSHKAKGRTVAAAA